MKIFKEKWRKMTICIIITTSLLVIAVFAGKIFQKEFNHQNAISSLQQKVLEKESEVVTELERLKSSFEAAPDSIFFKLDRYKKKFVEKGFVFFILDKDSLLFWSDNNIPATFLIGSENDMVMNSGNAWFRFFATTNGSLRFVGLYLIKFQYNYQNDYLENTFHHSFEVPCNVSFLINEAEGEPIFNLDGGYLFSIQFHPETQLPANRLFILFVLYLAVLLSFIGVLYELYLKVHRHFKRRLLLIAAFIADILIIRIFLYFFKIPAILYESRLFGPYFYAHSEWMPSMGDLFLNVLFLLIISFFIFYHYKFDEKIWRRRPFFRYFFAFSLLMHVFIFFKGIVFVFESIVSDSIVSADLNNIFDLTWMSLLSFLIISMAILAYLLITSKMTYLAYRSLRSSGAYISMAIFVFSVWILFCYFSGWCNGFYTFFVLVYILSFLYFHVNGVKQFSLSAIVFYIVLFSALSTYSLHHYNDLKEKEQRKMLALHLASDQRDPIAEYLFGKTIAAITEDTIIISGLQSYYGDPENAGYIEDYLVKNHFSEYWRKYNRQVTICSDDDLLLIQPDEVELECWLFFDEILTTSGRETQIPGLYFLHFGPTDVGYLAVLSFDDEDTGLPPTKIFIEITPKYVAKDLGFPDLLIDREVSKMPDLSEYSYSKYLDGELQHRVGKHFYNFSLAHYGRLAGRVNFVDLNSYNHCIYNIDQNRDLIISRKNKTVLDIVAPFSYLFLFYAVFAGILFLVFILPLSRHKISYNFRTRLQISMSAVILFSFLVIGFFTIIYIHNLNSQKNNDILSEKTHSVLVEVQHKLFDEEKIDDELAPYVQELLIKFSNVFFTDINLFGLDGELIASSRPQIFDEMLISTRMNPLAFKEMRLKSSSLFIQQESIGMQNYLSAYIPFVNDRNAVVAWLNLPYFAKENDLRREISAFLVAYINIYVILIAITILIALVISNYISRPIKLIMSKIREVNLGAKNEKIEWKHDDEIGQLVSAYNRMIDELAISADLLARSERESAWREMAKQVAHEIKNPLTPMKLSVQYLQHAWNNKAPDWENRLQKFTNTMIEQIETLSVIASEFSDFAKMPATRKEPLNISDVIHNAISLFKNYQNITLSVSLPQYNKPVIYADKDQMMRAFNNLLTNAVQAIGTHKQGKIQIVATCDHHECIIKFEDNGGGIPDEIAGKIFSPNFTTKSGGMGLGLAIVRSIIINSGGDIKYESIPGKGTTFIIALPLFG
jgi:two-component system, NtrC family, nitrogen regulation sensor histidine kinase NtrY